MNNFYIEYRFHGYSKDYLKRLRNELAHKFKVRRTGKQQPPHITLYGPFKTVEFRSVFSRIEKVAERYTLVPFSIDGFECRDGVGGKVIAGRINVSPELVNLRKELARELNKIVKSDDRQPWDLEGGYWFHTTILKDIDQRRCEDMWHYLNRKKKPHINQHLVRITILNRRGRIEREYDLVLKRWLNRREALSNRLYRKTMNKLRELRGQAPKKLPSIMNWLKKIFS